MKNLFIGFLLFAIFVISIITLAGMYKFNILQDDIFILGTAIESKDIIGTWVNKFPRNGHESKGFKLNKDGTASSINMDNLEYTNWKISHGILTLNFNMSNVDHTTKGNIQYPIYTVGKNTLTLKNGEIFRRTD